MSIATAARFLDCSEGHVRALLRQGLPSVTIGRCRRISKRDLETWLTRLPGAAQAVDQVLAELRGGRR
jgi:excisionase family DNA binding protein